MKKLILFLLFVGLIIFTNAQYFQTGQDPASLKWRQINTINFQIIYPDYYELQAQKLASIMEMVYKKGGETLKYQPEKISIVLHTQTVKSNGLVAWAPKRAEFYTIPHQDIYAQNWIEQLAIHEFRHVVQIDKVNSELPKIIKILLGEQGTALVFGAYLPWWFIEGDAVVTETVLSNSGRGRYPSFLMEHKALAVEKGNYKYDKAYNGSFKDYVPDHYELGYYLVGKSREKYGTEIWDSVLKRVGNKPFSLTPFNKAIKEITGFNKVDLYKSVFDSLKNDWIIGDKKYNASDFEVVSKKNKSYAEYKYNHWLNDSTIIAYKTVLNEIPSFVKINKHGTEKKLVHPGVIFNESVNYRGEWIVWSEQIPNPRWQHSGKSSIKLFNIDTNETKTINTEFTAFAPCISFDNSKIAVVESNFASEYFLSVYQISDGKLLNRFQTQNNNYIFSPEWLTQKEIIAIILTAEGKRLAKIDLENNLQEIVLNRDLGELKNIEIVKNNIYFISSYTGKNNLYRFNIKENSVYQVFDSRFGVESPAISTKGSILLSDYTANGYRLIKLETDAFQEINVSEIKKKKYDLAENLASQDAGVIDFTKTDSVKFNSEKYGKFSHLFNFHSWAPVAVDANSYEITPGISLLSQNKLGTALINLGYEWNITEKTGNFYGKYTFKGWYPVFDFELNTGKSASEYAIIEQTKNSAGEIIQQDTVLKRFTWYETNFGADVRVPLDFSGGKFSRFFQPEIKYDLIYYKHDSSTPEKFYGGIFQSITYRLYYQQLLRKSAQDVFPDFGIIADGMYKYSPIGETNMGSLILGQSYIYLPGLLRNHGIRLYAGAQDKNSKGSVGFSDIIRYPRGWGKINTNQMISFASDYKFPVFYPEWSIGGLVYLQRVNASIFADYANLTGNIYKNGAITGTFNSNISSFGFEVTGNTNFLRFYAPVEIGFRTSYLPEMQNVYFDFLFSIDFNSL